MSKRPVIVKKTYITNFYNTYNDHSTTNNDNRVTNNHTYVVRTKPLGEEPRQWVDETGVPRTNVAMVNWRTFRSGNGSWHVRAVDAPTRKLAHVGLRKDWDDAVRAHA